MFLVRKEFSQFGTQVDFQIIVRSQSQVDAAKKTLDDAVEKCEEIERIFSRFDNESELMKFNKNLGTFFQASPLFWEVAKLALQYFDETRGYFDPRILSELEKSGYGKDFEKVIIDGAKNEQSTDNSEYLSDLKRDIIFQDGKVLFRKRMDFTGVVKGFVVDKIAQMFASDGWKDFVVDCGGDMFFSGKDKKGGPWYIDIEGISYKSLMLKLENRGIATSGIGKRKWEIDGKRFHHLLNPKKLGEYSFDLKSVTVVASQTQQADVWAKALFVNGEDGARKFAQENKIACVILGYQGGVWISSELKQYLYKK